jgi:hypothetical protein
MRRLAITAAIVLSVILVHTGVGAEPDDTESATRVTGTIVSQSHGGPLSSTTTAGVNQMLGMWAVLEVEWSDPRLPSTMTYTVNVDHHIVPPDEVQTWAQRLRLDGPDGYWTGTAYGFMDMTGPEGVMVLTGEDRYEGLSAMLVGRTTDAGAFVYEGYVFARDLPPLPGAISAPVR